MATVSDETIDRARELRGLVGDETDAVVRALTQSWVREWDALAPAVAAAVAVVVASAIGLGRWPGPWELIRTPALGAVLERLRAAVTRLGTEADSQTGDAAERAAHTTLAVEPLIVASQLDGDEEDTSALLAAGVTAAAVAVLVTQYRARVKASADKMADATWQQIRRAVIGGVPVGDPNAMQALLMRRVEGAFNSGLTRAITSARTEIVDASRAVSKELRAGSRGVVDGWLWLSRWPELNVCLACFVMHGTWHMASEPGPLAHPACRCVPVPVRSGFRITTGEELYKAMSHDQRAGLIGAERAALLAGGKVAWADLVYRKENPGWRPAYAIAPLYTLRRIAASRDQRAA